MYNIDVETSGVQHGVGQGGFFTQEVVATRSDDTSVTLRFVYDCGTRSKRKLLTHAIAEYADSLPDDGHVDAVYISHWDEDHVNGLQALGAALDDRGLIARRIVLPPLSDLEALLLVLGSGGSPEWKSLIHRPAETLGEWFGAATQVNILSGSANPTDDPALETPDDRGEFLDGSGSPQVRIRADATGSTSIVATGISADGRFAEEVLWEVLPFVCRGFIEDAPSLAAEIWKLSEFPVPFEWGRLVDFELFFDADSRKRVREIIACWQPDGVNLSSVIVYSGSSSSAAETYIAGRRRGDADSKVWPGVARNVRNGWLGTGDSRLTDSHRDADNLQELSDFYGERLNQLLVVNAPHHGSDHSSEESFWRLVAPAVAVFNAGNSNSYNHPGAAVSGLCAKYSSLQVQTSDERSCFSYFVALR